jgi:hypothetical protein
VLVQHLTLARLNRDIDLLKHVCWGNEGRQQRHMLGRAAHRGQWRRPLPYMWLFMRAMPLGNKQSASQKK